MRSQTFNLLPEFLINVITSGISGKFLESSINLPSMEVILNNGLNKDLLCEEWFSRTCLSTLSMASPNGLGREMVEPYREKKGGWWPYLGECAVLFLHLWLVNEVMAHSTLLWLDLFSFQVFFFFFFLIFFLSATFQRGRTRWRHFLHLQEQVQLRQLFYQLRQLIAHFRANSLIFFLKTFYMKWKLNLIKAIKNTWEK